MRHTLTLHFCDKATFHVLRTINRHSCHIWGSENSHDFIEHEYDSLRVNVWCDMIKNKVISPLLFWRPCSDWWHFPGYDWKHCFASCPCGNSFAVGCCTTSLLPSSLYLSSVQGVSWSLVRKKGPILWLCCSVDLTSFDLFFGICKSHCLLCKRAKCEWVHGSNRSECLTNEMFASTWWEAILAWCVLCH
jgi:hypothetical protein